LETTQDKENYHMRISKDEGKKNCRTKIGHYKEMGREGKFVQGKYTQEFQ